MQFLVVFLFSLIDTFNGPQVHRILIAFVEDLVLLTSYPIVILIFFKVSLFFSLFFGIFNSF